ncbi:hypothetical protein [Mesorhizobium tamadayense]|uniref:hypothetical protein n=1 Tax=Mesorhizobium tamadayense TaxID=425306 RepID=UPI00142D6F84|nr:hypothetical protein [Mesorhizobium tamadayense]
MSMRQQVTAVRVANVPARGLAMNFRCRARRGGRKGSRLALFESMRTLMMH